MAKHSVDEKFFDITAHIVAEDPRVRRVLANMLLEIDYDAEDAKALPEYVEATFGFDEQGADYAYAIALSELEREGING